MLKKTIYLFLIVFIFIYCSVSADNSAGSTAGDILLVIPYSSVNASGNSGAGLANPNWQFLAVNPAYISLLKNITLGFAHNKYIGSTNQQGLTYVSKIKNVNIAGSITFFDYGKITRTTYSSQTGNGDFSARDYILSAYIMGPESKNIHTGLAIKYLNEEIDDYSASAAAFDAGILFADNENPFSAGLTLQNVGTKMRFINQKEDLPLLLKLGVAYNFFNDFVTAHIDCRKIKNKNVDFQMGTEINILKYCKLRIGYDKANDAAKGLTFGFDLNLQNGFELNYAYVPYTEFNTSHKFTMSYSFGKLKLLPKKETSISPTIIPQNNISIEDILNEGYRFALNEKYVSASFCFNKAVEIKPEEISPRLWLAYSYAKIGDKEAARREYENVLKYDCANDNAIKALKVLRRNK